jgi:tetratricopeptide (TPR) repeat protein
VAWYDRALEYAPEQPRYYAAVMMAFFARFTASNARPYYKRLKALAPQSTYVKWADGVFTELEGRPGTALALFEQACSMDNRNWYAHFSRANIYAGRGNIEYVRWARSSNYRYHPHGDTAKGLDAYRAIKNNAPTFPFIRVVEDWFKQLLERPDESPWEEPAFQDEISKLKRYGAAVKLGMY